jgi:hypothetical protein
MNRFMATIPSFVNSEINDRSHVGNVMNGTERAKGVALGVEEVGATLGGTVPKDVAFATLTTGCRRRRPAISTVSCLRPGSGRPHIPAVLRPAHNQEGNENLLQEMEGDDAYARGMQNEGVDLRRTPTGLAPRTPPAGFSWHHGKEPGVLELVPIEQHEPGSIFQGVLHPDGRGGYFKWGK